METLTGQAKNWIYPKIGATKLKDFTATDANNFFKELGQALSKRTLVMIKSTLHRSIRRAQIHNLIARNVVELIDLPSGKPGRPSRAMTQAQANKVLKTATGKTTGFVRVVKASKGPSGAAHAATETGELACGNKQAAQGRNRNRRLHRTRQRDTVTTTGSSPITTVAVTGGTTQATDYGFDNQGDQTTVKDEATSQTWTTACNLLGQVTSRTDPDSGTTSQMLYDGDGNLLQSADANARTLSWTYDSLNRKTAEYDAPVTGQAGTNLLDQWAYDNSNGAVPGMADPNGHLTTATSYTGGTTGAAYTEQASGFNVFGEPTGETITLPPSEGTLGTSYNFTHTYKATSGLPYIDTYPASPGTGALPSEDVTHGYDIVNGLELPDGLAGLNSYQGTATYTALGQVGQEVIGTLTANAFITNTYDPHTGQLTDTNLNNTSISATPIDDTSYTYDPAGNPLTQTETRQSAATETQCYTYDTLDRLTQAWTATDNCAVNNPASDSGATVGDGIAGAAYWTTWAYSPLGLRTRETGHGLSGTADTTTAYAYNGNGASQPDTLTSTSTTGHAWSRPYVPRPCMSSRTRHRRRNV